MQQSYKKRTSDEDFTSSFFYLCNDDLIMSSLTFMLSCNSSLDVLSSSFFLFFYFFIFYFIRLLGLRIVVVEPVPVAALLFEVASVEVAVSSPQALRVGPLRQHISGMFPLKRQRFVL